MEYAFRPVLLDGCMQGVGEVTPASCQALGVSDRLQIGGYGVELAIKNMEYSALDDSQVRAGWCLSICAEVLNAECIQERAMTACPFLSRKKFI